MKKNIIIFVFAALICSSYVGVANAENKVPSFLKEGRQYTFILPMVGEIDVNLLKIDQQTGWVQIKSERRDLKKAWMNLTALIAIKQK